MGRTLNQKKTNLYAILQEVIIDELLDNSPPFITNGNFNIQKIGGGFIVSFKDLNQNDIEVTFLEDNPSIFTVDFTVNGEPLDKGAQYSVKDYLKLMSTIAELFNQFLQQSSPLGLTFTGADSPEKLLKRKGKEQKNVIYDYLINKLDYNKDYKIGEKGKGGFTLVKN